MSYDDTMSSGLEYIRKTSSVEMTKQLGSTLASYVRVGDVVVLNGDLGAGKTHFVQGVAQRLGVCDAVTSPTFNILLSYQTSGGLPLHHFDLYRLDSSDQLEDIAYYETLDGDGVSFVEWGEKFPAELPCSYLQITITVNDDDTRTIRAHAFGDRARQLLMVWASDSRSRLMRCS